MIDFCAEHDVVSDVEIVSIQEVNEAWDRLAKNDAKYQFASTWRRFARRRDDALTRRSNGVLCSATNAAGGRWRENHLALSEGRNCLCEGAPSRARLHRW